MSKLASRVIFETDQIPDDLEIVGRSEQIEAAERAAGIQYPREFAWVRGAEQISGIIELPHDDYDRVYVAKGDEANPEIIYIPEGVEGDARPYYTKQDGKTYIYVDGFSGGGGTQANPYLVETAEDLDNVRNNLSAYYLQTADIDLSAYADGEGWVPIGDSTNSFAGEYDGGGHKITGLVINRPEASYQGLFGRGVGFVRNITISDCTIIGGGYVGAVVGCSVQGDILNCRASGTIQGLDDVGGITGAHLSDGHAVEQCRFNGTVTGRDSVGGIVGRMTREVIRACAATGHVEGQYGVGGVLGKLDGGSSSLSVVSIYNCYFSGTVHGRQRVGGVVGHQHTNGQGGISPIRRYTKIKWCYAQADLAGEGFVGGVVGYGQAGATSYSYPSLESCYALGGEIVRTSGESTGFGRIAGVFHRGSASEPLKDNYARSDMQFITNN